MGYPLFLYNPPSILVFCKHPLKSQIFQWSPTKLKFFILEAYFLSIFSFSPNDSSSKTVKNIFYLSNKLFLFSRYSVFVFLSSPLFLLVSHCFREWYKINLKVYDIINCLTKNFMTHFVWYLEKEKRYGIETLILIEY